MSAVLEAIRPIEDYLVMPDAEIFERIEKARASYTAQAGAN